MRLGIYTCKYWFNYFGSIGAWLGWTLLAGELPFIVAKDGLFPKWFAKENKNGAPVNALLITNILVQLFLISMLFTQVHINLHFH